MTSFSLHKFNTVSQSNFKNTHHTRALYKIAMQRKIIYSLYWLKAVGVSFNCKDRGHLTQQLLANNNRYIQFSHCIKDHEVINNAEVEKPRKTKEDGI